jgi:hypothetical protein
MPEIWQHLSASKWHICQPERQVSASLNPTLEIVEVVKKDSKGVQLASPH